jgi:hypothetical protein
MLAVAAQVSSSVNGREVILAVVGGTMLTLALTRPRLAWIEQLTEESSSARVWAERGLTFFLLVMAGYAGVSLLEALHKQLGPESDALLEGAAVFLFAYGWLVHFEPFAREWQLRGASSAVVLYTCVVGAAVLIGMLLNELALRSTVSLWELVLLVLATLVVAMGVGLYRWAPDFPLPRRRLIKTMFARPTKSDPESSRDNRPR